MWETSRFRGLIVMAVSTASCLLVICAFEWIVTRAHVAVWGDLEYFSSADDLAPPFALLTACLVSGMIAQELRILWRLSAILLGIGMFYALREVANQEMLLPYHLSGTTQEVGLGWLSYTALLLWGATGCILAVRTADLRVPRLGVLQLTRPISACAMLIALFASLYLPVSIGEKIEIFHLSERIQRVDEHKP